MPSSSSPDVERSAAPDDRERFVAAWATFAAAIRRARSRAADRQDGKLTHAQYHLLAALADGSALSVGELAQAAGVSSPTATRMLDCLEQDGIVTREPVPEDRRRTAVRPTAAGMAALAETGARAAATRDAIYAELTPAEREQAERLLPRLAEAIERL